MNVTIRKIGNSEGVILPKEMLARHNLRAGDILQVTEEEGSTFRLSALVEDADEFDRKMQIARDRMKKYEVAYRVLAK